ncbi:YraN family protein [soil metagenome]
MPNPTKLQTGNQGEQLAVEYLQAKGYVVVARNWRFNKAELDIVCQKDGITIFVEVKTRRSTAFGLPEEGVTLTKQKHLARGANAYILAFDIHTDVRFDILSIMLAKGKPAEILHIEDAFFPMGEGY